MSNGRKPPAPVRRGPTRSTLDSCLFSLLVLVLLCSVLSLTWPLLLTWGWIKDLRRKSRWTS